MRRVSSAESPDNRKENEQRMTSVEYVLGIDGGGTGCRVSLCDRAGNPLGQATGGAANYATDPAAAVQSVLATIQSACSSVSGSPPDLTQSVAHIGLAGVMNKTDVREIAAAMPFARVAVTDDRATTVAGAFGAADGVLLSVGTGSFAAAQRGGVRRFLGGWGHVLGDQASGAWLGVQALRLTILACDALVPQTDLTQHILDQCGGTAVDMLTFAKDARPIHYASLAPSVIEAARSGDAHGMQLMQDGARYLLSCLEKLEFAPDDRLCMVGGIGPHYAVYLDAEIQSCIHPPKGTALDGAVHLAHELL